MNRLKGWRVTASPSSLRWRPLVQVGRLPGRRTDRCQDGTARRSPAVATLLAIEAEAEIAHDNALVSDFAGVRAIAQVMLLEWSAYRRFIRGTEVDASWVERLEDRIAHFSELSRGCRNELSVARAANRIGRSVGEGLNAHYRTTVPPSIITMGSLAREIGLDAMASDLRAAALRCGCLRTAWMGLRPSVERIGAGERVAAIDEALEAVASGIARGDASQVLECTESLLAELRLLEAAFDDCSEHRTAAHTAHTARGEFRRPEEH